MLKKNLHQVTGIKRWVYKSEIIKNIAEGYLLPICS